MQPLTRRVLRANGVEIDFDAGRICRDGEQYFLRQKARKVLLCLVGQRDQPVSKDEIIRFAWDDTSISDDVLTGCIREIRKALGDDARQPAFIRTMPKNGYWFVAQVDEVEPANGDPTFTPAPVIEFRPPPEPPAGSNGWRPGWKSWVVGAGVVGALLGWTYLTTRPVRLQPWEIAWWRLDESSGPAIRDSVGGRPAQIPQGVSWVPGISGASLAFDGRDAVVRGEDNGALPRGGAPRTMSAWVRASAAAPDSRVFFQYGYPSTAPGHDAFFLMIHQSGQAAFGSGIHYALGRTRLDDGRWRHVAGVYDGHASVVYVDGAAEGSILLDKEHQDSNGPTEWSIGRAMRGGTPFRGQVDDIRVFPRALRPAEVQALYRCFGTGDLDVPGAGSYYFAPVHQGPIEISRVAGEGSARLRNAGRDYAGVSFVRRQSDCGLNTALASDVGQDMEISMEIRVGGRAEGPVASAGPYFRSRRSAPGDGIVGGESAGYWVELLSNGQVRVKRLNPAATVAFSPAVDRFDAGAFHELRVTVKAGQMEAALDGARLAFDQGGLVRRVVDLPPVWESTSPRGRNQGAAGVAFACEGYRGAVGGQEVRNIRLTRAR